jgi:nucleotide-binding universal stress UspA family protein
MATSLERDAGARPYRVVVGVELDGAGDLAFVEAIRLAEHRTACELHIAHVLKDVPLDEQPKRIDLEAARLREYVEARVATVPVLGRFDLHVHVRLGSPAQAIAQLAVDLEADLIVVGTHARTGVAHLFSHSAASDLVAHAHCPVLVVRPVDYAGEARSAAVQPPCAACIETRRASAGRDMWCARHSGQHAGGHSYSYRREHPMRTHDSSVVPTGIDPGRVF